MDPAAELVVADCLAYLGTVETASIDLVYADPPFLTQSVRRTGAASFADRFESAQHYIEWLRPRLVELHRVLAEAGSIFIHIDYRTTHHVRLLLDEVFGHEQFRNEIIWRYGLGGRAPARAFARKHDSILFYARDRKNTFHAPRGEVTEAMERKYRHIDASGRRYMNAHGRRYQLQGGKLLDSVWEIASIAPTSHERVGYPTQKPLALLERIILAASQRGETVLDPFLGSGTTAVAALSHGRLFRGCDLSADAVASAQARIAPLLRA